MKFEREQAEEQREERVHALLFEEKEKVISQMSIA